MTQEDTEDLIHHEVQRVWKPVGADWPCAVGRAACVPECADACREVHETGIRKTAWEERTGWSTPDRGRFCALWVRHKRCHREWQVPPHDCCAVSVHGYPFDHVAPLEWVADRHLNAWHRRRALLIQPYGPLSSAQLDEWVAPWANTWGLGYTVEEPGWHHPDTVAILFTPTVDLADLPWNQPQPKPRRPRQPRSTAAPRRRTPADERREALERKVQEQLAKVERRQRKGGRGRPPRFPWRELRELADLAGG